jgi:hypothetical protein
MLSYFDFIQLHHHCQMPISHSYQFSGIRCRSMSIFKSLTSLPNLFFQEDWYRLNGTTTEYIHRGVSLHWSLLCLSNIDSPSLRLEYLPINLSDTGTYATNATPSETPHRPIRLRIENLPWIVAPSSVVVTTNEWPTSTGRITISTDVLVRHVAEKLFQLLADSSTRNVPSPPAHVAQAATLHSVLTEQNVDRQKQLLIRLLHEYFPSQNRVEICTQVITIALGHVSFYTVIVF